MIEQFKRDGYVVVQAPGVTRCMPDSSRENFHAQLRAIYDESVIGYLRHARMLSRMAVTQLMFTNPNIWHAAMNLGVSCPMFQTAPTSHIIADDLRIPEGYHGTGPHQDYPALQSSLNAITVWIPYWDCDEDNYPLELVPGSHLNGLLPAIPGEHISEVDTTGMEFVPVPVKRGEALLFSAFMVHRTRTPGKGLRVAFSHRYEDAADPWFIENKYPSAQSRSIRRAVDVEPTTEQVRSVFA